MTKCVSTGNEIEEYQNVPLGEEWTIVEISTYCTIYIKEIVNTE